MSRCRSCRAPIRWATTETGKNIPLDLEPVPKGNLVLEAGVVRVVPPGEGRYVSHFSTCPNSKKHRQKG